jgi:hypothetical protein
MEISVQWNDSQEIVLLRVIQELMNHQPLMHHQPVRRLDHFKILIRAQP